MAHPGLLARGRTLPRSVCLWRVFLAAPLPLRSPLNPPSAQKGNRKRHACHPSARVTIGQCWLRPPRSGFRQLPPHHGWQTAPSLRGAGEGADTGLARGKGQGSIQGPTEGPDWRGSGLPHHPRPFLCLLTLLLCSPRASVSTFVDTCLSLVIVSASDICQSGPWQRQTPGGWWWNLGTS